MRPALEPPRSLKGLPLGRVEAGELPSLAQLGFTPAQLAQLPAPGAAMQLGGGGPGSLGGGAVPAGVGGVMGQLRGGEGEALRRLQVGAGSGSLHVHTPPG